MTYGTDVMKSLQRDNIFSSAFAEKNVPGKLSSFLYKQAAILLILLGWFELFRYPCPS